MHACSIIDACAATIAVFARAERMAVTAFPWSKSAVTALLKKR
jgi:hypothetical protein